MLAHLALVASTRGLWLDAFAAILLFVTGLVAYFLWPFLTGAGYQPVPGKALDEMIEFSHPEKGMKVYDLGSGFGRIILKVAQRTGATCVGVEIDPLKVWWTRLQIDRRHLAATTTVVRANLLSAQLSDADIVFVFLWEGLMRKLRSKVMAEMKEGAVVVSYYHEFHDWTPTRSDPKNKVFMYTVSRKHTEATIK